MWGGLALQKLTKSQLICSVSWFNLGGLGALFQGAKPPKPPRGDGTVVEHNSPVHYSM